MLEGIKILSDSDIAHGDRWVYSADFNVSEKEIAKGKCARIDTEIPDMKRIIDKGSIVILAHQGRYGAAKNFDFLVPYLVDKLDKDILLYKGTNIDEAVSLSERNDVILMDNMRLDPREEANDAGYSQELSKLGAKVAVGGFGKAHRLNASNVGVLSHRPGYIAQSMAQEIELLQPWSGEDESYSVAVLGGVKKEKLTTGFGGLSKLYDLIIPGGLVLNCILKEAGYKIGSSVTEDDGKDCTKYVAKIIDECKAQVYLPEQLAITDKETMNIRRAVRVDEGVPDGYMIADFFLEHQALSQLDVAVWSGGRILMAGTPGIYKEGFCEATDPILERMRECKRSLVLGGDTANEVKFSGTVSTGGGSALEYLVKGDDLTILQALRANMEKFR